MRMTRSSGDFAHEGHPAAPARGVDAQPLRRDPPRAFHRAGHAAPVGQGANFREQVRLIRRKHRLGAHLQRPLLAPGRRLHPDHARVPETRIRPPPPAPPAPARSPARCPARQSRWPERRQTKRRCRRWPWWRARRTRPSGMQRQQPVWLEHILRKRAAAVARAVNALEIQVVLAVDVVAGQAQRAFAARKLRQHHHPVAHLHPARLRHRHHFARALVARVEQFAARQKRLVFRAQRRGLPPSPAPTALEAAGPAPP